MVTGDHFAEESIWDSSDTKVSTEPFSLWGIGNEMGTFIVRSGFKKPPKRFALKIASPTVSSGSDDTVIDAEIKTFSAAVFDDYGGLVGTLDWPKYILLPIQMMLCKLQLPINKTYFYYCICEDG